MMRFFKAIVLMLIAAVPFSSYSRELSVKSNLSGPIDISAEYLEEKRDENVYIAKGNVEVKQGTQTLNADYVRYNKNTSDVFAEGHVVFRDQEDVVHCERISLNLLTKTGTIEKGNIFIKQGNFHIVGEEIEKVGELEYAVKNGEFTTCEGESPSWKFAAKDVEMTVEGYAKTKGTTFLIHNHAVFYLPWGMFPVKAERQSGYLMPQIRFSSRDGPTLRNNSYFLALSKDKDATLSLDLFGNRGVKPGAEFRYALSEDFKGSWFASIIQDRAYDGNRFQIRGQHEQHFKDATIKLNGNYVSDNEYVKDFGLYTAERSQNMLKSTGYIEKPFGKSLTTYEMAYFKDLTQRKNDNTFQYLPFASFFTEYIPVFKNRLYTDMYAGYTNFYRDKGDTYSRMAFEPSLRMPFSFNGVNLLVNSTAYETGYLINHSDTEERETKLRQTAKIEGNANVQFLRNYHMDYFNVGEMQSVIKPQVRYVFIPNTSFSGIPSIDPYDRFYRTNTITYGFNHYLNAFTPSGFREVSLFELAQTYGLSGNLNPSVLYDGSGNRLSDIRARLTVYPKEGWAYINDNQINTSGQGLVIMRNTIKYTGPSRLFANITHSYTNQLVNELFYDLGAQYKDFDARYQLRYSFTDGKWIDTLYQIRYHPGCWALTLQLIQSTRPSDTTVRVSFDFIGITTMQTPYP